MKINEDEAHLNVAICSSGQMTAQIEPKRKIDVLIGDAAKMDCERAINYIKSGTTEIKQATQEGIESINQKVGDLANVDLSNLSPIGEAKFAEKQNVITSDNKLSSSLISDLAMVAITGDYDDLSGKPTIPIVNDATLTIQKNGESIATFTANSATNATANIAVPTDTADLTNGAGFITSSALPTVNNPTITLTQGGETKGSFTLNQATGDTIALDSGGYRPDILTFQWSDHLLNNVSWLRADTFSWQDGTVYEAAYEHLTDDITGITPTTETVGSNTITVYVASDGHKIVLEDQAQTVADIYDETGVAWYFILDTTNTRFKLPRTKFGFTGLRNRVGDFVEAGLPNITGVFGSDFYVGYLQANGCFGVDTSYTGSRRTGSGTNSETAGFSFSASRSSSIYGNSTTVQPSATEMYLYFYVGNYTQEAIEQTAGLNAELFNSKLDVSTFNATLSSIPHIVETYKNGNNWYRIWSDGWCEQGGQLLDTSGNNGTVTFLIEMKDTSYYAMIQAYNSGSYPLLITAGFTTTSFSYTGNVGKNWWQVKGYVKE
ncbi:MAG: hypothetical protein IJ870_03015 [Alphaproteobacteria bacterium]|nr:hypothetical protein [Alphaproteobacteria bacterium]